jgi:hypothetical protein
MKSRSSLLLATLDLKSNPYLGAMTRRVKTLRLAVNVSDWATEAHYVIAWTTARARCGSQAGDRPGFKIGQEVIDNDMAPSLHQRHDMQDSFAKAVSCQHLILRIGPHWEAQ